MGVEKRDFGLEFLEAFKEYLRWRLSPEGPPPLAHEDKFVALLKSLDGDPRSAAFQSLVSNMKAMKETQGRTNPLPGGSEGQPA